MVAGGDRGRTKGIPCVFQPLKEGYRSWASGFCMSKGVTPEAGGHDLRVRQLVPSGWAGAYLNRQGYYSAVLSTAKANMEPYEWAYWMEGKPAEKDIHAPDGSLIEKAGAVRDGGSYDDAHGRGRLLELGHGRERLHGPQMERVHRLLRR